MIVMVAIILIFPLISAENIKYDKDKSKNLYVNQCSKCHKYSGDGIRRIYPPLKNSDYVRNGTNDELLRGMIYGRSGKIVVNGQTYNGVMTTEIDASLSNGDIALILMYVYKELNGMDRNVNPKEIDNARKAGKLPVKQ
jgi:nitrite reductase (NO-forming)